jgi:hypothetical protein
MNPTPNVDVRQTESVRLGQKYTLSAVFLHIAAYLVQWLNPNGEVFMISLMVSIIMILTIIAAIYGFLKMTTGLGYHIAKRLFLTFLLVSPFLSAIALLLADKHAHELVLRLFLVSMLFLPCVSIIVLVLVNVHATTFLRHHGYKVGLLGAGPR